MRAWLCAVVVGAASVSAAVPTTWRLELATMPEYVAGFPLPIALTLTNATANTGINDVPGWSLWSVGRAQLTFVFVDGAGQRYQVALPKPTGDPMGDPFAPGQSRRMLFDLSLLDGLPPPGSYQLRVTFTHRGESVTSNEAPLVLRAPGRDDVVAAAKLSRGAPWSDFVAANWRAVASLHASAKAEHQLALHRFVQRAVYGPEKLAAQPLSWLDPLAHGLAAPEGELFRVELLAARHDAQARAAAAHLASRVPGLKEAATAALEGRGELGFLRQSVGAERGDPPGPNPYGR